MQSVHPSPYKLISLADGRIPLMSLVLLYLTLCLGVAAQSRNQASAPLIREGQSALDAGDFSRAVQTFEKAEQLSPEDLEVNRGLVLSYLHAGQLIDAQRGAEPAVEGWPRDAQLRHWLGLVYFKQGQNEKALAALRYSESLKPSLSDIHFDIAL